ncbi:MAG: MGH1-like glycoside hydrolase domain-containing protein [Chloroflexota bacterium]
MSEAESFGQSGLSGAYSIADNQLAVGSTLGGPKMAVTIRASGAIDKVYSIDLGAEIAGAVLLRHYDARSGMYLAQQRPGAFVIHPEYQQHHYGLPSHLEVRDSIFVLSGKPAKDGKVDPPAVYQRIELHNGGTEPVDVVTYAYAVLRGKTSREITAKYDKRLQALVYWNEDDPEAARVFGCSAVPETWETTLDYAKSISESSPGPLSCTTDAPVDPLGALQHSNHLEPQKSVEFTYLISCGKGRTEATKNYRACPPVTEALQRTSSYYSEILRRSVVLTPDAEVNRGVLWAKANMLRIQTKAETGWGFTNDPTRSNNSVARDTAWFALGADYMTPEFARESLSAYVRLQEKNGMMVEYYDLRTGDTEDYGLNINDNTPLIIMALWHHYNATGDEEFLRKVYPATTKAARYILSQRNAQGLVWCNSTVLGASGIIGWRNVIPNYRLSGATTEVNSECYSALVTASHMARALGKHKESEEFADAASELRKAINTHLLNPETGLYYLHIDVNGHPRSDITSDLVFPLMFGVADDNVAAHIIARLSNEDFWTSAGIRTVPRDSPNYTPKLGWGLLGGVWVAVSFWYAFAAAKYAPSFMAHALSTSFWNYSSDPKRHNTVPGQFSEWLNGETLVNEGMMLSPWFPPRYLWAAIEGMAGFNISQGDVVLTPRLPPDWKWMAVQNLLHRGQRLTWVVARTPELKIFTNFLSPGDSAAYLTYEEDISDLVQAPGEAVCTLGMRHAESILLFAGNTSDRTLTTSIRAECELEGRFHLREFNSLLGEWVDHPETIAPESINSGLIIKLESKGFSVLQLRQEV